MPTRRGQLFAVVAYQLGLYSAERRLEKEKCSFYCVLCNKINVRDGPTRLALQRFKTTVLNCAFAVLF